MPIHSRLFFFCVCVWFICMSVYFSPTVVFVLSAVKEKANVTLWKNDMHFFNQDVQNRCQITSQEEQKQQKMPHVAKAQRTLLSDMWQESCFAHAVLCGVSLGHLSDWNWTQVTDPWGGGTSLNLTCKMGYTQDVGWRQDHHGWCWIRFLFFLISFDAKCS